MKIVRVNEAIAVAMAMILTWYNGESQVTQPEASIAKTGGRYVSR